jgi:hypothetical protein
MIIFKVIVFNIYLLYHVYLAPTREERAALNRSVRDFEERIEGSNHSSANDPFVIKPGHFKKEDNLDVEDQSYADSEDRFAGAASDEHYQGYADEDFEDA